MSKWGDLYAESWLRHGRDCLDTLPKNTERRSSIASK